MKYDFVDRLIEQRESHGKSSGQADVLESVNSYDANGNLINDSRRALNFVYNVLDLLSEVRSGGTLKASYTWLADGTKLCVRDGSGANGFEYVGSLIYRKSGSSFELSEALFGDGVIRLNDNGTQ